MEKDKAITEPPIIFPLSFVYLNLILFKIEEFLGLLFLVFVGSWALIYTIILVYLTAKKENRESYVTGDNDIGLGGWIGYFFALGFLLNFLISMLNGEGPNSDGEWESYADKIDGAIYAMAIPMIMIIYSKIKNRKSNQVEN